MLIFYECMIALNVETIDDEFEDKEIRRSGKSFSRDYEMLTIEICFLGNIYFSAPTGAQEMLIYICLSVCPYNYFSTKNSGFFSQIFIIMIKPFYSPKSWKSDFWKFGRYFETHYMTQF